MKITALKLHPVAIADPPLRSSYGLHAPYAIRTIVEIETDEGIRGIAETYGGDRPMEALRAAEARLIGMDVFQLTRLWMDFEKEAAAGDRSQTWFVPGENPLDQHARTFAAIEFACLDALGKALNKPVCDLLGGRARDEVPFSAYLFYKHAGGGGLGDDERGDEYGEGLTPEAMVRQAKQMIGAYGFREIKLKGGVLDPEVEIETIRALRRAFGPTVPLRIDPNCAWSVDTSVKVGESLVEELSAGGYLEDPCASLEGMAEVRKRMLAQGIDTPQASNVAVTSFHHIPQAWKLDAVQIVLSDPHYWGGLRAQQQLDHFCKLFGMGVSMHSNNHLGVSLMAMTHAAAACPHLHFACDTHYPWQTGEDEVVAGGRIPFVHGSVQISNKPGLGIELDYDQLARLKERYEKMPYRKRDDEAEMRKRVDPHWQRILPRW
ncbi:MAG TPA: enolase C-terminal domain-like protein [Bryobacteraceae bacterium]|nr:enolase C-terminal domain-like protein [Bryobacteraceae bacterium]